MSLTSGTRIGTYDIVAKLGEGGMGEVYRARDTRLDREVAIKMLPAAFAADEDRLARFQREARVLASLNHPNIGGIYGLEESDGIVALVMELVPGEDLSQRIAKGAIPLDEALPMAKQIAEALEAAHEHGIIHRDLKPANIKVRDDGTVKVLDFGLAKAVVPVTPGGPAVLLTNSPTITSPALVTGVGIVLGTAAYMAPEQAKGRPADRRCDIWAFGVVVFEMLTGRRAFDGDDVTDVLGAVVRLEPAWDALPSDVPPPVRTLLQSCLVKDPRGRVADISTALFVLEKAASLAPARSPDAAVSHAQADAAVAAARQAMAKSGRLRIAVSSAAALLAGAGVATTFMWFATRPSPRLPVRTMIAASGARALTPQGADRDIAITPDGLRVIYRGTNQLLVRALDQLEPTVLVSGGAPQGPFVSPDGQWVGFFDGTAMKKVAITGGPVVTIAPVVGAAPRGATWGVDGTIIFATETAATALQRVSAAGGEPTTVTTADRERGDADHVWPEFLPGGEAVLFTVRTRSARSDNAQIAVLDLRTGTSRILVRGGSDAHYSPSGHIVYGFAGTLRAVAFDLARLEVIGTPAPVLEGVLTTAQGAADVAVASDGSLIYVPGVAGGGSQRTVAWVDRQGRASPLPGLPLDEYRDVRISPDGTSLAVATEADVWIYWFATSVRSRLTTDPARDTSPIWAPDGRRVIFTTTRAGYPELFWRMADGTGTDERLFGPATDLVDLRANGWSADRKQLLFTEVPASIRNAIGQVSLARPSEASMLIRNAFSNDYATVSPGGGWMAYQSTSSGRFEIYVEQYPQLGNRQQISTEGGRLPLWSRDERELFFSSPDGRRMFAVPVKAGVTFVPGRARLLFEYPMLLQFIGNRPYDIAPDGRFAIIRSAEMETGAGSAQRLELVQNWQEELKRLVPIR